MKNMNKNMNVQGCSRMFMKSVRIEKMLAKKQSSNTYFEGSAFNFNQEEKYKDVYDQKDIEENKEKQKYKSKIEEKIEEKTSRRITRNVKKQGLKKKILKILR